MDRMEPYIGMPIILGDSSPQVPEGSTDRNPQQMESAGMMTRPPARPMPLPEIVPQEVPQEHGNCQPCLTDDNCRSCQQHQVPQQTMRVGMAYVPWQKWQQPYSYEEGFAAGTIFPDLHLPFLGYQGGRRR